MSYEAMVKVLDDEYGESKRGLGFVQRRVAIAELYTAADGTWTMVVVKPNGETCIVISGSDWFDPLAETALGPET